MKPLISRSVLTVLLAAQILFSLGFAGRTVSVHGYTRKDGTYVAPHTRTISGSGGSRSSSYRSTARYEPRETVQQTTGEVFVTKTGTKYHSAGCRHLSKSAIPMTLEEASRKYSPCSTCHPPSIDGATEDVQPRTSARTVARTSPRMIAKDEEDISDRETDQEKELTAKVQKLEQENEQLKAVKTAEAKAKIATDNLKRLERQGAGRLAMAKDFLRAEGTKAAVREAFEKIARENSGTKAADEAAKILKEKWGKIATP